MSLFQIWTITYITTDGNHSHIECENEEQTRKELEQLKQMGLDMNYVNVYPAHVGYSSKQFLDMYDRSKTHPIKSAEGTVTPFKDQYGVEISIGDEVFFNLCVYTITFNPLKRDIVLYQPMLREYVLSEVHRSCVNLIPDDDEETEHICYCGEPVSDDMQDVISRVSNTGTKRLLHVDCEYEACLDKHFNL